MRGGSHQPSQTSSRLSPFPLSAAIFAPLPRSKHRSLKWNDTAISRYVLTCTNIVQTHTIHTKPVYDMVWPFSVSNDHATSYYPTPNVLREDQEWGSGPFLWRRHRRVLQSRCIKLEILKVIWLWICETMLNHAKPCSFLTSRIIRSCLLLCTWATWLYREVVSQSHERVPNCIAMMVPCGLKLACKISSLGPFLSCDPTTMHNKI